MRVYTILITLLFNYEKAVHIHNYMFFWKGLFWLSYFNFMALKPGIFKVIYSGWIIVPPTFILEEQLIQNLYNLMQFLSNLSKIIPSQKTADIIL